VIEKLRKFVDGWILDDWFYKERENKVITVKTEVVEILFRG
jgi:hypothetical protein